MTIEKDDMPKRQTGVHRRSGTSIWQWRIKAPIELRHLYPSEWAHRCSLRTADLRKANDRASQLYSEWQKKFEEQRKTLNPHKLDRITPELARLFAERAVHDTLASDERTRSDPTANSWLLRWMRDMDLVPEGTEADRLSGLPDAAASVLDELHLKQDADSRRNLARGRLAAAFPGLQYMARSLGYQIDDRTPGIEDALRTYLQAIKEASTALVQRDSGEVVPTPKSPQHVTSTDDPAELTLRDVFDLWKDSGARGTEAVATCERALKLWETHTEGKRISVRKIVRRDGDAFRAYLLKLGASSKTSNTRFTYIKTLLRYASRDLDLIAKNPWEGLDIEYETENRRRPWTTQELQALFGTPLFTEYKLPTAWNAGGDAAYWIPLLALFSGARVGELCQLRVEDVLKQEGHYFLRVTDEADGATLKTSSSVRDIPLHSQLCELGFLDYVEHTRKSGSERLWPNLRLRDGKPGSHFSAWFGKLRKTFAPPVPDLHSFRHTVRSAMTEARIEEAVQDRITGHDVRGSTGTRVYSHPKEVLRHAVESIRYDGLTLKRTYRRTEE